MMITLFLCGDVMTGRGIDQVLAHPSNPALHEPYVVSALEYLAMADRANGPIPKPILYGCGDFIDDYEGIAGYEEFRNHLILAYFVTIDPSPGGLLRLEMSPLEIQRFQLHRAGRRDAEWLQDTLSREGRRLGTGAKLERSGRLPLEWRS